MRRVQFPVVKDGNLIVYPDDISKFSNGDIVDGVMVANYSGDLPLEDYDEPVPAGHRRIRQDAFLDRFTMDEQLRLDASADPMVRVFEKNAILVSRPYIDLDHPLVQQALPYLRDNGLLDGATQEERQARLENILSDGAPGELP